MKKYLLLSLLLFGLLPTGCTSSYFGDRGRDFADCWQLQFRVGRAEPNLVFYPVGVPSPGIKPYPLLVPFYGTLRLTKFLQMGSGAFESTTYGTMGRASGVWSEKRGEFGVSLLYFSKVEKKFISGNADLQKMLVDPANRSEEQAAADKLGDIDALEPTDRGLLSIGGGFQVVTVGFDIGFDLIEFADFIFGIFNVDFQKDDVATLRAQQEEDLEEEEVSPRAQR